MPTRAASGEPVVLTSYGEASRAVCRHVWLPQPPLPLALLCGTAAAAAALIPAPHTFLCAGTEGDEARGIAQRIQARLGVAAVEQDGRPANKCFWRACSCCYMPPTARWPRLPPPVLLCWFTRAHAAPPPPPPPPLQELHEEEGTPYHQMAVLFRAFNSGGPKAYTLLVVEAARLCFPFRLCLVARHSCGPLWRGPETSRHLLALMPTPVLRRCPLPVERAGGAAHSLPPHPRAARLANKAVQVGGSARAGV